MLSRLIRTVLGYAKKDDLKRSCSREFDDLLFRMTFGEHGHEGSYEAEMEAIEKKYRDLGLSEQEVTRVKQQLRLR